MKEIWENIEGFNKYKISNFGNIRSLKTNKILKAKKNKYGYLIVNLYKNKKCITKQVHRLVIENFLGKKNLQTNHKNGIKEDNRLKNLEYCTNSQNQKHRYKNKKYNHLKKQDIIFIRKNMNKYSIKEFQKIYNKSYLTIKNILNYDSWKNIIIK